MRCVLFGKSGILGSAILETCCTHELFTPSSKEIDFENYDSITKYLEYLKPQVIFNCAAIKGEKNNKLNYFSSYQVNAVAPKALAIFCTLPHLP